MNTMKKTPDVFDNSAREDNARTQHNAFEESERKKDEEFNKMVQFAIDTGCSFLKNRAMRYIEFKTWQDALDFKGFYTKETNKTVEIAEPPKKDYSPIKQGFRVFSDW